MIFQQDVITSLMGPIRFPTKKSSSFFLYKLHKVSCHDEKYKSSYGFGVDSISNYSLKIGMPILAPSVCQMFNWPLSTGTLEVPWKIARAAPIFIEGSTEEKSNYMPISVLLKVSHPLEKIIFHQLSESRKATAIRL